MIARRPLLAAAVVWAVPPAQARSQRLRHVGVLSPYGAAAHHWGGPAAGGGWSAALLWRELHEMIARIVGFVDRVLRGAQPSELPVEQPSRCRPACCCASPG